jgi:hypothetical protein
MKRLMAALSAAFLLALAAPWAHADEAALRSRYESLREELRHNHYGRALHIDSAEQPHVLQGDVYAVLDHPFATVSSALRRPSAWCDVLILPFNTKYCHAVDTPAGAALQVRIGRRYDQPVEHAHRLEFVFREVAASRQFFASQLNAETGPVGTRDYRITVQAVPVEGGRTFLHLSYAYGYGTLGRLAMRAYLATAGADKVGFSLAGRDAGGQHQFIGGVRGAVERNAMRYYLAIDTFLDSLSAPPQQQAEQRIQNWFTATERYPRQLREMDRRTYVTMKRLEVERQQTLLE